MVAKDGGQRQPGVSAMQVPSGMETTAAWSTGDRLNMVLAFTVSGAIWGLLVPSNWLFLSMMITSLAGAAFPGTRGPRIRDRAATWGMAFLASGTFAAILLMARRPWFVR